MAPKLMGKLESDPSGEPMWIQDQLFRGLILRNTGLRVTSITSQRYNHVCVSDSGTHIWPRLFATTHFLSAINTSAYTLPNTHTHAPIYTSTLIHLPPPLPTVQCAACCGEIRDPVTMETWPV